MTAEDDVRAAVAAEWVARCDRGLTAEEAASFARWKAADPRHGAAVAELTMVWDALDGLSASIRQQRADGAAVAPSAPAETGPPVWAPAIPARRRPALARWWPAWGLAAALVFLAGLSWSSRVAPSLEMPARYETAIGAQRTLTLSDGSELRLNTDTLVTVRFSTGERRVTLERGETFFQVAKDPARPFVVAAGLTEARVLGTAFVVRLRPGDSEVLVSEGRVKFGAAGGAGKELHARQRATLARSGAGEPRVETLAEEVLARRLAWQFGRIEFKDTPLREVVAEFNRYHRQRLVVRDAATGEVRIGGPFEVDNLDGFVRLLDASFEVKVTHRDVDEIVLGLRL